MERKYFETYNKYLAYGLNYATRRNFSTFKEGNKVVYRFERTKDILEMADVLTKQRDISKERFN